MTDASTTSYQHTKRGDIITPTHADGSSWPHHISYHPYICCVFFTSNRSFHPSTPSTISVRADSSNLRSIQDNLSFHFSVHTWYILNEKKNNCHVKVFPSFFWKNATVWTKITPKSLRITPKWALMAPTRRACSQIKPYCCTAQCQPKDNCTYVHTRYVCTYTIHCGQRRQKGTPRRWRRFRFLKALRSASQTKEG